MIIQIWFNLDDMFYDLGISRIVKILVKFCPKFIDLFSSIYGRFNLWIKSYCYYVLSLSKHWNLSQIRESLFSHNSQSWRMIRERQLDSMDQFDWPGLIWLSHWRTGWLFSFSDHNWHNMTAKKRDERNPLLSYVLSKKFKPLSKLFHSQFADTMSQH